MPCFWTVGGTCKLHIGSPVRIYTSERHSALFCNILALAPLLCVLSWGPGPFLDVKVWTTFSVYSHYILRFKYQIIILFSEFIQTWLFLFSFFTVQSKQSVVGRAGTFTLNTGFRFYYQSRLTLFMLLRKSKKGGGGVKKYCGSSPQRLERGLSFRPTRVLIHFPKPGRVMRANECGLAM